MQELVRNLPQWFPQAGYALSATVLGVALALLVHRIVFALLGRVSGASERRSDDILVTHLRRPALWSMVALGIVLAAREVPLLAGVWEKVAGFVMPALIGWMALAILKAFVEVAVLQADITVEDNVAARRKRTRLAIFNRMGTFLILFLTIGLMLLSIPGVRQIGVTLMASAGLAGLAVGAAAQPALKSLIAGLQMALTEPVRIDDLITIDGETGRVEDIRATFVIIRVWDERRMIVPTSRFLDTTFITATRYGSHTTGTVMLYVRPESDVAAIRAAFLDMVRADPRWDGRKAELLATNSTIDTVELRLTMTAKDAADSLTLRSAVREAMLAWMREHLPAAHAPLAPVEVPPA
ncbi:MAG: mechanosensitive ion channel domain-containing protein [Croceibacterium sp.]